MDFAKINYLANSLKEAAAAKNEAAVKIIIEKLQEV